jgi:predicted MFS family arabinose efflux permease
VGARRQRAQRGADRIGLEQGFAFALFNLAWALGFTIGSAAGGGVAEAAGDGVPYLAVAALFGLTAAWTLRARRREPALRLPA